ncbi:MAG: hypothetical protein LBR58_10685 [Propionibacteriaceae bacterium]|jgi:hypothetical protein|nr:hypothetical protein [Propionibacteriaceae bacterium]
MALSVHERDEASEIEERLLTLLRAELRGRDLKAVGPLDAVVTRMVASIPEASRWSQTVGPVYTTRGLSKWLGISRQAIHQFVQQKSILRLTTADGVAVYPAFQFDDSGRRLPGLREVVAALASGVDDAWTWAAWLNAQLPGQSTMAQRLRSGDLAAVLAEARADAQSWIAA